MPLPDEIQVVDPVVSEDKPFIREPDKVGFAFQLEDPVGNGFEGVFYKGEKDQGQLLFQRVVANGYRFVQLFCIVFTGRTFIRASGYGMYLRIDALGLEIGSGIPNELFAVIGQDVKYELVTG